MHAGKEEELPAAAATGPQQQQAAAHRKGQAGHPEGKWDAPACQQRGSLLFGPK